MSGSAEHDRTVLETINSLPMPELGDAAKLYLVRLSEPEINSIYAAVAFVRSELAELVKAAGGDLPSAFWSHYGPTLQELSDRLSRDFDGK